MLDGDIRLRLQTPQSVKNDKNGISDKIYIVEKVLQLKAIIMTSTLNYSTYLLFFFKGSNQMSCPQGSAHPALHTSEFDFWKMCYWRFSLSIVILIIQHLLTIQIGLTVWWFVVCTLFFEKIFFIRLLFLRCFYCDIIKIVFKQIAYEKESKNSVTIWFVKNTHIDIFHQIKILYHTTLKGNDIIMAMKKK